MPGTRRRPQSAGLITLLLGVIGSACTRAPLRDPLLLGLQPAAVEQDADPSYHLPPISPMSEYAVVLVPAGESLAVRDQAGTSGNVVAELRANQRPIRVTGVTSQLGSSVWVEIELPGGGNGWVRAWNLTEARPAEQVCSDARLAPTLDAFLRAAEAGDASALQSTVSPWRGLSIRLDAQGGEVRTPPESVGELLSPQAPIDWLARPEAGAGAAGSFLDDLVAPLAAAVRSVPPVCGELPAGQTTIPPEWPAEYANLTFVAFHTPADPTGSEYVWKTWAIGFDFAGGEPFLAVIIRYQGEI